jgi:hydrophobe/amphiphile efflux-3 (HAE3) family protein
MTQLSSDASVALLTDPDGDTGRATQAVESAFGSEPVALVVTGALADTLSAPGMTALQALEARVRKVPGVQTAFGPATLVDTTIEQIARVVRSELGPKADAAERAAKRATEIAKELGADKATTEAAAREARLESLGPLRQQYEALFARFGAVGIPALTNPAFVQALTLGAGGAPKARLRWMLPDGNHAIVLVRLRRDLDDGQIRRAGEQLQTAARAARKQGLRVEVAGAPLVAAAVSRDLSRQLGILLPAVIAIMMLVLVLAQRAGRRRALLLVPALAATAVCAGLSWPLGLGLTPATLAALPVILGLGIDFVVQIESRYREARTTRRPHRAASVAVTEMGPLIIRAGCAMAAGFLVLLASPVPLVQRLGLVLALGVAVAVVAALLLAPALLVALDRRRLPPRELAAAGRLGWSRRRALVVTAISGVLLVAGILSAHGVRISGDPNQLASSGLPELERAIDAGEVFGSAGQVRVAVRGRDVSAAPVVRWMSDAQTRIGALDRRLRPGPSLTELVTAGGRIPGGKASTALLDVAPPTFVRAFLTPSRGLTEFSFGAPLTNAQELTALQTRIDGVLASAPAGVTATAGGLVPTLVVAVRGIQGGRPWLLLAAIGAIALLLLAFGYGARRTLVIVLPAAVASGASSLALSLSGVSLSPLSASLEPLLVAIAVEFAIIVEMRIHAARRTAGSTIAAATLAPPQVGFAVLTSAVTAALGFAVLVLSPIPVLRQFGALAAVEVLLAAAVILVLVPALTIALERRNRTERLLGPRANRVRTLA